MRSMWPVVNVILRNAYEEFFSEIDMGLWVPLMIRIYSLFKLKNHNSDDLIVDFNTLNVIVTSRIGQAMNNLII